MYYPTGRAICRRINQNRKVHGIRCSAESTRGSIFNINSVRAGEFEFGIAQSDWHYHAFNGTSKFTDHGPFSEMRSLLALYAESFTLFARDDSGIENLTDVKGKRFNIGRPGSGTRVTWEIIEKALGWNRSDLKLATELKARDAARALCDGEIDAFFWIVGHPSAMTQKTLRDCDTHLVQVCGDSVKQLLGRYVFYRKSRIPARLYGNQELIHSFGLGPVLFTRADVPEDVVYHMVKAVFDDLPAFKKMHPAYADLRIEEMNSELMSAPLHPGAVRYYRERGWM